MIKQFLAQLFQSPAFLKFKDFCNKVFTAEKSLLLASLKDFAMDAVKTAEATGYDSVEKRSQAFKEIVGKAKVAGIKASDSIISLALEMAVQVIKEDAK